MATVGQQLNALYAQQRQDRETISELTRNISELKALMDASIDSPRYIEDIPGKRVPYMAGISITISANSTSRVEGTFTVSRDGPFIVTALHMAWARTTGAYQGWWGPATTYDMRIAANTPQMGLDYLFDQVVVHSFDVEIADKGSDRNWQNIAFASSLFSPQMGGIYGLPVSYMFDTNSVCEVRVTPNAAQAVAGKVLIELLGYKIVQGSGYQP
jgi:hypothetical protein